MNSLSDHMCDVNRETFFYFPLHIFCGRISISFSFVSLQKLRQLIATRWFHLTFYDRLQTAKHHMARITKFISDHANKFQFVTQNFFAWDFLLISSGDERVCVCFACLLVFLMFMQMYIKFISHMWQRNEKNSLILCRWTEANKSELEATMLKIWKIFVFSNERKVFDRASTDTTQYCSHAEWGWVMMHDELRIIFVNKQMKNNFALRICLRIENEFCT